jgi:hypothetical protein
LFGGKCNCIVVVVAGCQVREIDLCRTHAPLPNEKQPQGVSDSCAHLSTTASRLVHDALANHVTGQEKNMAVGAATMHAIQLSWL